MQVDIHTDPLETVIYNPYGPNVYLPPLPRHPIQKDAPLLHRYASEGLYVEIEGRNCGLDAGYYHQEASPFEGYNRQDGTWSLEDGYIDDEPKITGYAIDAEGNRHDIAIEENEA